VFLKNKSHLSGVSFFISEKKEMMAELTAGFFRRKENEQ
jgi:hypothetical protein